MNCPRDGAELKIEHHRGIEVDHCPTCNGRWLDHDELDEVEATVITRSRDAAKRLRFCDGYSSDE